MIHRAKGVVTIIDYTTPTSPNTEPTSVRRTSVLKARGQITLVDSDVAELTFNNKIIKYLVSKLSVLDKWLVSGTK